MRGTEHQSKEFAWIPKHSKVSHSPSEASPWTLFRKPIPATPGLPLGAAELAAFLYGEALKKHAADPAWLDRDRFVLSAGHGSMFLYSILHLAGYGLGIDDIKRFRKIGSACPGHPERGVTPGVETTTGPLGQGIANAVGMAIAETMYAARFNTPKHKIFDHYTYALTGDGCLQEGVAAEASSLAGHLGLGKLILFYDSNAITIDGSTSICFTEDVAKRYEAYGWKVLSGDMYDLPGLARLLAEAKAETAKPKLIILKSLIGKGAPTKQGSHAAHGAPLGTEEVAKAKVLLGIPAEAKFWVAPEAYAYFEKKRAADAAAYKAWQAEFAAWEKEEPALAAELAAWTEGRAVKELDLPSFKEGDKVATRNASGAALQAVTASYPSFMGGSADLTGPNVSQIPGGDYNAGQSRRAHDTLRHPRARHGGHRQRHGPPRHQALRRDLPRLLRLPAALAQALGPHGPARGLRPHPRLGLRRRGRPDP